MTSTQSEKRVTARSIADDLRGKIRSGQLLPGSVLPTTKALAEEHGVSSKTVSAGIDLLKLEGLVVGEQGGRRRVRADRPITWNLTRFERGARRDSAVMDDWSTAISEAGRTPEQHVSVSRETANSDIAGWLQVPVGDDVVKRVRMRTVDGRPFQLSTSYFPKHVAVGTLLEEPGDVAVPGGILSHIGHPQLRVRDEISVRMPSPEESQELALPPGTPVAQHVRVGYGETGPVRVMVTIAPGDRHTLVYELEV
uniref:TraR protein n=1 Tax=Streptomyces venezuelae TaxID=54571 RepID=Q3LAJ7_STRVZ|nr:GntR family transcriptional regulator [Streptomyces venezuelae]CAJ32324.1 TraR protein [Streptomyces venezuelae]